MVVRFVCVLCDPVSFYRYRYRVLVGLDGCEVRLCGPRAFVRPRVPCVP